MSKFRIVVGDWSGDGHSFTKEFTVIVPDQFTADILGENYTKSVAAVGVDPEEIAKEYEDSTISQDVVDKLVAHGLDFTPHRVSESLYIGAKDVASIVMFLFGYGLDGFTWEFEEPAPVIAGGYRVVGPDSIGYGTFMN